MTDDQGYGDIAAHGNPWIQTPNLDRLHSQSVRGEDFHVEMICSPTRGALLTGTYPLRNDVYYVYGTGRLLDPDLPTAADLFSAAGYRTGLFGKWHLGATYPYRPEYRGFDHAFNHNGVRAGGNNDYWGNDYFDDTYFLNGEPTPVEGYCTDVWFEHAIDYIGQAVDDDAPFFVYIPTNAPHEPLIVPDSYAEPYREMDLPDDVARFYGMITNIDWNLGRLMSHLSELGVDQDTILVFLTDNGSAHPHYNAGMRGEKTTTYEGGLRVPLFVRWPGQLPADEDFSQLAAHVDVLPTLLDLCDITTDVSFDGRSLRPLLEGDEADWSERTHFVGRHLTDGRKWETTAVMTEQWRLVNGAELFDIVEDPGQENDVSDQHPDVVDRLREAYQDWWTPLADQYVMPRYVMGADGAPPQGLAPVDRGAVPPRSLPNAQDEYPWPVRFARSGRYRFVLRRYAKEAERSITDRACSGDDYISSARLGIKGPAVPTDEGTFEETTPVETGDRAAEWTAELGSGPAMLQAEFECGESFSTKNADYIRVTYLD